MNESDKLMQQIYGVTPQIADNQSSEKTVNIKDTIDNYLSEIEIDGKSFKTTNEKFLLLVKGFMNQAISDIEYLKNVVATQERQISQLRSAMTSALNSNKSELAGLKTDLRKTLSSTQWN